MIYFIVQLLLAFGSFMGIGQAVDKSSTLSDKIVGYIVFALFLFFILWIEGVLK